VKTGVSNLPEVAISPAIRKSGTIREVQISVYPVHEEQQRIVAVQAVMRPLEKG
jgi:hypothetical protein